MTSSQPRPETINELRYGPGSSLAMVAGVQLDLFTLLKDGPMTLEQMAGALDVRAVKLRPLLYALVVAGLLNVDGELFSNTPEAEHFLVKGSPAYMGGAVSDLPRRWSAMLNTAESIRTGLPQAKLDFSEDSEEELERFLRAIQPGAMAHARELIDRYDFSSCRTLADIGGGSGGMAIVIAEACPQIRATVIDLPTVTPIAHRIVRESAAADRISVSAADAIGGPIPGAYDVAVLRALIQVLSPDDAVPVLRNVYSALNPGGVIHILGQVVDNSRTSPVGAVEFTLLTLNLFDEAQAFTEEEYARWLAEAGFEGFTRFPLSADNSLITACKPT